VVTPRGLIGRSGGGDEVSSGECKVVYGKVWEGEDSEIRGWGMGNMRVFGGIELWLFSGW
jgi:hypothetical protein